MTSNQLAYAANKISQQIADETERHNRTTEDELNRHNVTAEQLTSRSNQIESEKASEVARHNQQMENIQRRYNELYLAMQKSQGDERLRIQNELALVEQSKAEELNRHNRESEIINHEINAINASIAAETNRHNEAMEANQLRLADLQERQTNINEKQVMSQNMYWNGVLANEQLKIANQNYIGLAQLNLDMYGLKQRMLEWSVNKKNVESQTFRNYFNSISDGVKVLSGTLGALQVIGGAR